MFASPEGSGGFCLAPRLLRDVFMPVSKPLASDPLYRRSYDNASVLICKIVDYGTAVASVSGQQQLQWLHLLHTSVDNVLRGLRATKVDSSGDTLTFVSGTENGDEEHAASLVGLAQSLLCLHDSLKLPNGDPLRLQLSLHTGEVVSGLVGNLNLKYGVYGDTVSIARYLQRSSGPGVIVASAQSVRTLPDVRGWQQSGSVNLPNGRMLAIFAQRAVSRTEQNPQGIHIGPHVQYRDEGQQPESAGPRTEALEAGNARLAGHRRRCQDVAVLGLITSLAMLSAICLALQGRMKGVNRSERWALSHSSSEAEALQMYQVAAATLMWAVSFCFASLSPLYLYTNAREYMIVTLRCLLLLRTISTVTVASPGAMAGIVSALLEPYRGHSFIPWAALDFLAAPSAASGLQRDLGLPVIMLGLSTMLPVTFGMHFWSGLAMVFTLLVQDDAGFPSADFLAGLIVLGIGVPALLQMFSDPPRAMHAAL